MIKGLYEQDIGSMSRRQRHVRFRILGVCSGSGADKHVRDPFPAHARVDLAMIYAAIRDDFEWQESHQVLRQVAASADQVYLATDPDREGRRRCGFAGDPEVRVRASSSDYVPRDHPERDREVACEPGIERLCIRPAGSSHVPASSGIRSARCWAQCEEGTSAVALQSVALRLVVEREREIQRSCPRNTGIWTPCSVAAS